MNEDLIMECEREIINNIFNKLEIPEQYVLLELNRQLQDKINKIDKAIEYIRIATDNITEYLDIKEIKELLEILGDKENE